MNKHFEAIVEQVDRLVNESAQLTVTIPALMSKQAEVVDLAVKETRRVMYEHGLELMHILDKIKNYNKKGLELKMKSLSRRIKVLPLDNWQERAHNIYEVRNLTVEQQEEDIKESFHPDTFEEIEPIFNRNGQYYDRYTKESWCEVYLTGRQRAFKWIKGGLSKKFRM